MSGFPCRGVGGEWHQVELLFYARGPVARLIQHMTAELQGEVDRLDQDYLLKVSEEDLCEHLIDKYHLHPPVLHAEDLHALEAKEVPVDVSGDSRRVIIDRSRPHYIPGTSVTVAVPFDGDANLFQYQPSTYTLNPPHGDIANQAVHLTYVQTENDPAALRRMIDADLQRVMTHVTRITADVTAYNNGLPQTVRQMVSGRKARLLAGAGLVESLGIPIRRREDVPQTYTLPSVRRKPKIERPKVSPGTFAPEPALEYSEYQQILSIVANMVRVMEQSPKPFTKLGEEELRTHFLVQLNGQYEGRATGETFNYSGKTDILIREGDKNVFIAECKFWRGPKAFVETIDQLLSYASWRDTKTAILLFNRGGHLSTILAKLPDLARGHPCFKKDLGNDGETTFRYRFGRPDDPNRELWLTVMVFDVPSPTESG